MAAYCEVFQRIEKKYRITKAQRRAIESVLSGYMCPDAFGETRVTSLYLDTPDKSLISRSLEKPLYKEKIRVRVYGCAAARALEEAFSEEGAFHCAGEASRSKPVCRPQATWRSPQHSQRAPRQGAFCRSSASSCAAFEPSASPHTAFFEIKKKYKGVVYKRRMGMSPCAAAAFFAGEPYEQACRRFPLADEALQEESLSARSLQIAHEVGAMLARYDGLEPSMAILCDRVAWKSLADEGTGLRITFDANLAYQDAHDGVLHPIVSADECIMEIKNAGPLPLWLVHALSSKGIRPASFSKYGTAYRLAAAKKGACCA